MNRIESLNRVRGRKDPWDVVVIGGGATGVGCALDAATRGLAVLLVEQDDLGKGTSSRSTKLIHGGVRYLAQANATLVREALRERGILQRIAPDYVTTQAFIIPCFDLIDRLQYRVGLKLYDVLAGSLNIGRSRMVRRVEAQSLIPNLDSSELRGAVEYFDESGRSLKKFLIRKPIAEGVLRSGFGYRRHPILGYAKMHTGVDWANRIGTPIIAAGNGTVIKAEWDSGYGRRVELQHANGYVTAYSHMSRFGRGVAPGARMRQGQVIGYVGSTGLSTGPHLHYEVVVNGHFVDPMKIRVPRGRELDGRPLADFKRQREQVDDLLKKAGGSTRLAQGSNGRT